jgi:hypothetical protein
MERRKWFCGQVIASGATLDAGAARSRLAALLQDQGRTEEAERMWKEAISAGSHDACDGLVKLLRERNRGEEADRLIRDGLNPDG